MGCESFSDFVYGDFNSFEECCQVFAACPSVEIYLVFPMPTLGLWALGRKSSEVLFSSHPMQGA